MGTNLLLVALALALAGAIVSVRAAIHAVARAVTGLSRSLDRFEAPAEFDVSALLPDLEVLKAKVELLPATYDDFWKKARAAEERTRRAIRRAEDDGLDLEAVGISAAEFAESLPGAEAENGAGVLPLPEGGEAEELPSEDIAMQLFQSRLGNA